MAQPTAIHIGGLHYLLWQRRLAENRLRLSQQDLCAELIVDKAAMSRVIQRMVGDGRLTRLERGVYRVNDPALAYPLASG